MKIIITFRDFKIFMIGMVSAFIIALIIYNIGKSEQVIIAEIIQYSVITMIVLLMISIVFSAVFGKVRTK